jgi:uncharacterized membrane protein YfhO
VILERRSAGLPEGSGTGGAGGTADYRSLGPQSAEVTVDAPSTALVLIRTPFDRGWTATVDGRPRPVIPADYVDQGVSVPPGHHVIELRYEDPAIGQGLVASVLVIAVILGVAVWLARRERRRAAAESSA